MYSSHVSGFSLSDKRGTRYGEQIDSINGQLDPTDPSPVLSTNFYVSDEDPNIVSELGDHPKMTCLVVFCFVYLYSLVCICVYACK